MTDRCPYGIIWPDDVPGDHRCVIEAGHDGSGHVYDDGGTSYGGVGGGYFRVFRPGEPLIIPR